jgi:hypothetical protein
MLYYYIKETDINKVYVETYFGSIERRIIHCEFEDYPTHKHRSHGGVYAMEVIPERRYRSVNFLCRSRVHFDTIELSKDEVIKVGNSYYIKAFEKKHKTEVWERYLYSHKEER